MRTRLLAVAAVLALPLTFATACGSDDDTSASDPGSTSSTSESNAPSPSESGSPTESTETADPSASSSPSDTTSPTSSPSPTFDPSLPACSAVWKDRAKLPVRYAGCNEGETSVAVDKLPCSSGQTLVRYDGRFWAVFGGRIAETDNLKKDKGYLDAVSSCRA